MKIRDDAIHCIKCRQTCEVKDAKQVFKTGFFDLLPLGVCKECDEVVESSNQQAFSER